MILVPRRFLSVGITVAVLLAVIGGTLMKVKSTEAQKAADAAKAKQPVPGAVPGAPIAQTSATEQFSTADPIPVEGVAVRKDTLRLYVVASATAEANRELTLTAEAAGRIATLPIHENDKIKAGSLVMQLDTADFAMDLNKAKLGLMKATQNYKIATIDLDEIPDVAIRMARDSALRLQNNIPDNENTLAQAQMAFAHSSLKSPFEGRIADVKVIEGQRVNAGTEIATLLDMDPIKVEAEALEADIGLIAPGARARVTFAALGDQEFIGRVTSINPMVGVTRTARVTVTVPNPNGVIYPGMTAKARLEAKKYPDRIIIPREAVLTTPDGRDRVFIALKQGDKVIADWRYVKLGMGNDEEVEVVQSSETSMLKPGEIVVTKGHYTLAHGSPITVVDNAAAAGARPD